MTMGGEILRAVITKNTPSRRYKVYSASLIVPAATPVGVIRSTTIEFNRSEWFLWTSTTCHAVTNLAANPNILPLTDYLVSLTVRATGKRVFNIPTMGFTVFGTNTQNMSANDEYTLFSSNDALTINVTPTSGALPVRTVNINFIGIEYTNGPPR